MKVLIAEDDLTSRKLLRHFISGLPNVEIVGEVTNGEELIRCTVTEKPDLALVDIGMPLLNGMEAIKSCKKLLPALQVIFITGCDQFALEAFSIRAIDYILKPIEKDRFYDALERASRALNCNTDQPAKKGSNY